MNALPGANHDFAPGANRNGLGSKADALRYFQAYLESVSPPIKEHTTVTKVQQGNNGLWRVETPQIIYETRNVVICTGGAPHPIIPAITADIPPSVRQLHSSEYRNPEQLMKGNILVVGSGSSGVQICEDLAKSNRFDRLYLAVSGNFSFPWKVMGIPIHTILRYSGFANINRTSWLGKRMYESMKGKGDPATPPSPAALNSNYGVELVGRVVAVDEEKIRCSDEQAVTTENLTIVWCTGFNADYDYIEVESRKRVFDNEEDPIHERGVASGAPGLYFIGLRFQYTPYPRTSLAWGRIHSMLLTTFQGVYFSPLVFAKHRIIRHWLDIRPLVL